VGRRTYDATGLMTRIARIVAASRPKRQCKAQAAAITGSATVHAKNADEAATERARRFSRRRSGSRTTDALWATVGPRRSTALADARNCGKASEPKLTQLRAHHRTLSVLGTRSCDGFSQSAAGHRLAGRTARRETA
jgi:hypothetical protein